MRRLISEKNQLSGADTDRVLSENPVRFNWPCQDLYKKPTQELVSCFKAHDWKLLALDLRGNQLYLIQYPDFTILMASLSKGLRELDLSWNLLGEKSGIELAGAFKKLPISLQHLNMMDNNLHEKLAKVLAIIFENFPVNLVSLNLSLNGLGSVDGLARAFAKLSRKLTCLDLGANNLSLLNGQTLKDIFQALPDALTMLGLSQNNLYLLPAEDFILTLEGLAKGNLTDLDLSTNGLGYKAPKELARILAKIPENIISLDLSDNQLGRLSLDDLQLIINAVPSTVGTVILRNNELFINKTTKQRDAILEALPVQKREGQLVLSNNGENSFARALLPLLSAVKQNRLTFELASIILSTFLPRQDNISSAPCIREIITHTILDTRLLSVCYKRNGGFTSVFFNNEKALLDKINSDAETMPEGPSDKTLKHFCLKTI